MKGGGRRWISKTRGINKRVRKETMMGGRKLSEGPKKHSSGYKNPWKKDCVGSRREGEGGGSRLISTRSQGLTQMKPRAHSRKLAGREEKD